MQKSSAGKFHGIPSLGYWRLLGERLQSGLFGLDIRLAYDAAVLLVLFAKMRAEVHAAHHAAGHQAAQRARGAHHPASLPDLRPDHDHDRCTAVRRLTDMEDAHKLRGDARIGALRNLHHRSRS